MFRIPALVGGNLLLDGGDLFWCMSASAWCSWRSVSLWRTVGGRTYQVGGFDIEDEPLLLQIL